MRVTITSPARVVWADNDQLVTELNAFPSPFSVPSANLADDLSQELIDLGVVGGDVTIRRTEIDKVAVDVYFWSPTALDAGHKEELLREVLAQWSDGLGEGGLPVNTPAGEMLVFPSESIKDAALQEDDDGRVVERASRVAIASREGLLDALKAALSNGDDINAQLGGFNGLHLALVYGHPDAALHLIENGVDVNGPDRAGRKPLRLVATANDLDDDTSVTVATALLLHGAVPDASVTDFAQSRGKTRLVELLNRAQNRP